MLTKWTRTYNLCLLGFKCHYSSVNAKIRTALSDVTFWRLQWSCSLILVKLTPVVKAKRSGRVLRNCTEPNVESRISKKMVVAYNSSYLIFSKVVKRRKFSPFFWSFCFGGNFLSTYSLYFCALTAVSISCFPSIYSNYFLASLTREGTFLYIVEKLSCFLIEHDPLLYRM